jgi:hypothetical protein
MLVRLFYFSAVFAATGVYAQNEPGLVKPGVKSIEEKYEWLDSWGQVIKSEKTLFIDFYSNGMMNSKLFYNGNGDIAAAYHYILNKDSLIGQEEFFTETNKRWVKSDKFLYRKKAKNPYQSRDEKGTVCYFKYTKNGLLSNQKSVFKNGSIYELKSLAYDSSGRLIKEAVYFGDKLKITLYQYEKDADGNVLCNIYRQTNNDYEIKFDEVKNGIDVSGISINKEMVPEEIYVYNAKGELKEIQASFKNNKPMVRKTYLYTYYGKETSLDTN